MKRASLPPAILTTFYRGTVESVLAGCINVWFVNRKASGRKTLQRIVRTTEKIIGLSLPSIQDIFQRHCAYRASSIVNDPSHPSHRIFAPLPSGRRYHSIRTRSATASSPKLSDS